MSPYTANIKTHKHPLHRSPSLKLSHHYSPILKLLLHHPSSLERSVHGSPSLHDSLYRSLSITPLLKLAGSTSQPPLLTHSLLPPEASTGTYLHLEAVVAAQQAAKQRTKAYNRSPKADAQTEQSHHKLEATSRFAVCSTPHSDLEFQHLLHHTPSIPPLLQPLGLISLTCLLSRDKLAGGRSRSTQVATPPKQNPAAATPNSSKLPKTKQPTETQRAQAHRRSPKTENRTGSESQATPNGRPTYSKLHPNTPATDSLQTKLPVPILTTLYTVTSIQAADHTTALLESTGTTTD